MKYSFLFVLAFLFRQCLYASEPDHLYFIHVHAFSAEISFGEYSFLPGLHADHINMQTEEGKTAFEKFLRQSCSNNPDSVTLFFTHAMWGSEKLFAADQMRNFFLHYVNDPDCKIKTVFYIFWDTGSLFYSANQDLAKECASSLHTLFTLAAEVKEKGNYHFDLMCHSMSNLMFFSSLQADETPVNLFDHIVLAAPDVSNTILDDSKTAEHLFTLSPDITVLYSNYDRALIASFFINQDTPLGLIPPTSEKHLRYIDCTHMHDIDAISGLFTGHLYYCASPTVREKIKEIFNQ